MPKINPSTLIEVINQNYNLAKNLEIIFYQIPYEKVKKNQPLKINQLLNKNRPLIQNIIKQSDWLLQVTSYIDFSFFDKKINKNFITPLRDKLLNLQKLFFKKNLVSISNHDFALTLSNLGNIIADFIYHFSSSPNPDLKKALREAVKNIQIKARPKGRSNINLRFKNLK